MAITMESTSLGPVCEIHPFRYKGNKEIAMQIDNSLHREGLSIVGMVRDLVTARRHGRD